MNFRTISDGRRRSADHGKLTHAPRNNRVMKGRTFGELQIRRRIWRVGKLGESDDFSRFEGFLKLLIYDPTNGSILNDGCENYNSFPAYLSTRI